MSSEEIQRHTLHHTSHQIELIHWTKVQVATVLSTLFVPYSETMDTFSKNGIQINRVLDISHWKKLREFKKMNENTYTKGEPSSQRGKPHTMYNAKHAEEEKREKK